MPTVLKYEKNELNHSLQVLKNTKNYNNWIYDNIKKYIGSEVLEIGCGTGNVTGLMVQQGRRITGIDIEKEYTEYTSAKFKGNNEVAIFNCDFTASENVMKKNYYDTVIMLNVLEHIEDDAEAVKSAGSFLKRGGVYINLVPAMKFAFGELDRGLGHYRRYEKKSIIPLLAGAGFDVEKIFYMNFIGAFAWALNSVVLKRKKFPSGQPVVFDRLFVPVLKLIEAVIRPPVGQSLISIARKK